MEWGEKACKTSGIMSSIKFSQREKRRKQPCLNRAGDQNYLVMKLLWNAFVMLPNYSQHSVYLVSFWIFKISMCFCTDFCRLGFTALLFFESACGARFLSSVLVTCLPRFRKAWWVSQTTTLKHPGQNQTDFLEISRFIEKTSSSWQELGSWEGSDGILLNSFEQTSCPRWLLPLGAEHSKTQEIMQL